MTLREWNLMKENELKFLHRMTEMINKCDFSLRGILARKWLPNWLSYDRLTGKVYYTENIPGPASIAWKKVG